MKDNVIERFFKLYKVHNTEILNMNPDLNILFLFFDGVKSAFML